MRSFWKVPFFSYRVRKRLRRTAHLGRKGTLVLRHRRFIVDSFMAKRFVSVHNGRTHVRFGIHPRMVGHRHAAWGPFRSRYRHLRLDYRVDHRPQWAVMEDHRPTKVPGFMVACHHRQWGSHSH